ncbi:hypothetical protein ACP70R_046087 [Stipagrostis hirtigluma subsp. patula]
MALGIHVPLCSAMLYFVQPEQVLYMHVGILLAGLCGLFIGPRFHIDAKTTRSAEAAMEKRIASILLMLSLEALIVFAGLSMAAIASDVDAIRLPTDATSSGFQEEGRPWECCDVPMCTKSRSGRAVLERLQALVQVMASSPTRYVCEDTYTGEPGPKCREAERPWECCDVPLCTKSIPPICHCADQVARCSNACKSCVRVMASSPTRYVCKDAYTGEPGPNCKEDGGAVGHGGRC